MTDMTRRTALAAGAALAAAPALAPSAALSQGAPAAQAPGFYRYRIGSLTVTALHDGGWNRQTDATFVRNAQWEEVQKAMTDAFMPAGVVPIPFTQLVIETGDRRTLIDTGTGGQLAPTAGQLAANLQAAGIAPASIQTVVISHFHADHINGLKTRENALAFANAEVLVPQPEWAFWMDDGQMSRAPEGLQNGFRNVRRVFGDMGERVKRFEWDKEVVPGVTALDAGGHTPGHTAFLVASGSEQLLVLSDTTNHPALFVRNPDWSPVFDMDADRARAGRRRLLDRAAADRLRVAGYHFPFPATGHILKDGARFAYVPAQWAAQI